MLVRVGKYVPCVFVRRTSIKRLYVHSSGLTPPLLLKNVPDVAPTKAGMMYREVEMEHPDAAVSIRIKRASRPLQRKASDNAFALWREKLKVARRKPVKLELPPHRRATPTPVLSRIPVSDVAKLSPRLHYYLL